jgi:hypothetical protein
MAIQANPAIAKAEELLHRLGSLEEVRRYHEAREKTIRDEANRLAGAREEGEARGEAKGKSCPYTPDNSLVHKFFLQS